MTNTEDHTFCTLDRQTETRMPFHDTAICIEGDTAMDLSHHFVHLWNNAMLDKHGKSQNLNSITTNAKNRGLFRNVFKKMTPQSTAGVVSMGYTERSEFKRQENYLKKLQDPNHQMRSFEIDEEQCYDSLAGSMNL